MPYITRDDGERFVIPSYRDVLSAKKPSLLKREVLLLSSNYGEYVALQRKNIDQYEAAFSPDPGYLLGETIWQFFKRPIDLIYCEAIPNTTDAILVIVKSGSVYLDGSFPVDSIPDELVVFRTQQNNFEVYIAGDVPISEYPEKGKFSLDESSVKSFTVLDEPVFPKIQPIKAFQLRLVDVALKAHGIGVIPVKKIIILMVVLGLIWMAITYFSAHEEKIPTKFIVAVNPYQPYIQGLTSPNPTREMQILIGGISQLYTIPGWYPSSISYSNGMLQASIVSLGMRTKVLYDWVARNNAVLDIQTSGFYLKLPLSIYNRMPPTTISPVEQAVAELIDRLSYVLPGNNLTMGQFVNKGQYTEVQLTINITDVSLQNLFLIGQQFDNLPLVLSKVDLTADKGVFAGTIVLKAMGN